MPDTLHTPACFASHMGLWLMEPTRLAEGLALIRSGRMPIHADSREREHKPSPPAYVASIAAEWVETRSGGGYWRHADGIAVIHMTGTLMKGRSKYGGTSTIATREALRAADGDQSVTAVLLAVDSPGGHVAGTQELADQIAAMGKPVAAHADDLMASAAYWPSAQASDGITANRTAEVGSIGTVAVVYDSSKRAEMEGVQVHVVSTGAYKGAFTPGTEISEEHLAYLQERVDDLNGHFLDAVAKGRGLSADAVRAAADGRVFSAGRAAEMGLIDGVGSLDDALAALSAKYGRSTTRPQRQSGGMRPRMAVARARIAAHEKEA